MDITTSEAEPIQEKKQQTNKFCKKGIYMKRL
jgi:hypothetical protein